jgi:mRNA interferase MazF
MTTASKGAPYRVPVLFRRKRGLILLDQIRAIDEQRLARRLGTVDRQTLELTLRTIQRVFAAYPPA